MKEDLFVATLGTRGVLHPGRFLWLRAMGWMILVLAVGVGVAILVSLVPTGDDPDDQMPGLTDALLASAAALAVYVGAVRLGERRWPVELDPRSLPELLLGIAIGAGIMSLIMAVLVGFDWYDLRGSDSLSATKAVAVGIQTGVVEELVVRGVIFRLLTRAFNVWWALLVSAVFFGVTHLTNPGASAFSAFAIALEAGVLFAALYVWTGRLWASIGVHASWNFFQGYVYGAPVSGFDMEGSLLEAAPDAGDPALLTGGAFGPEASLAALSIATAAGLLTLWRARDRLPR